jgi:hypothetical protein
MRPCLHLLTAFKQLLQRAQGITESDDENGSRLAMLRTRCQSPRLTNFALSLSFAGHNTLARPVPFTRLKLLSYN